MTSPWAAKWVRFAKKRSCEGLPAAVDAIVAAPPVLDVARDRRKMRGRNQERGVLRKLKPHEVSDFPLVKMRADSQEPTSANRSLRSVIDGKRKRKRREVRY
jgi:hypothetical protein